MTWQSMLTALRNGDCIWVKRRGRGNHKTFIVRWENEQTGWYELDGTPVVGPDNLYDYVWTEITGY